MRGEPFTLIDGARPVAVSASVARGPRFREMLQAWTAAGHRYYEPLP